MESASQAPVTFSDIMCQMHDMLSPEVPGQYTLRDLRKSRALAGTLFNILFNLGKFVAYETRDPFMQRQEKADDPDASDWDRYDFGKVSVLNTASQKLILRARRVAVRAMLLPCSNLSSIGLVVSGAGLAFSRPV